MKDTMYFLPISQRSSIPMKTRRTLLIPLIAWGLSAAANLQPRDMLFISTHRNPAQIVSDDKVAYLLTEGGVLMYDYRRQQWMDNIGAGMGISQIAYNPDRTQLLMKSGENVFEYNPAFRRVSSISTTFQGNSPAGADPGDLNGLQLGADFTFLPGAGINSIRDRYNRRANVTMIKSFNYDDLWVLTAGHGAFHGSFRRKDAASAWFGLYDSSVTAVYTEGKNVWFGSPNPAGALVKAKGDLSEWKVYAAQQDYDFPDGTINDIVTWRDFLWIATAKGVVRQDITSGQYHLYRQMQGATDMAVNRLYVHQDRLYAGTANGVAVMDEPESRFHNSELPININPVGHDFCSSNQDLWAATSLGLFVLTKNGWKSIKDVTHLDVPEALGSDVPTVGFRDSSLFWASSGQVYEKPRRQQTKSLFNVSNVFRILFEGDNLFAGFDDGVRVYNLKSRLWVDFRLEDGIPGHKAQCFFVRDGVLWIGTDLGVMRIKLEPYLPS
jgi:hypothetical protein